MSGQNDFITVNGDLHQWHEGLTVADLLSEKNFTFPLLVIKVNDLLVKRADYASSLIPSGAVVIVHHMVSGG